MLQTIAAAHPMGLQMGCVPNEFKTFIISRISLSEYYYFREFRRSSGRLKLLLKETLLIGIGENFRASLLSKCSDTLVCSKLLF